MTERLDPQAPARKRQKTLGDPAPAGSTSAAAAAALAKLVRKASVAGGSGGGSGTASSGAASRSTAGASEKGSRGSRGKAKRRADPLAMLLESMAAEQATVSGSVRAAFPAATSAPPPLRSRLEAPVRAQMSLSAAGNLATCKVVSLQAPHVGEMSKPTRVLSRSVKTPAGALEVVSTRKVASRRDPIMRACRRVLKTLLADSRSEPFREPVNAIALDIPTYFDIVRCPMDLGTIQARLDRGAYATPAQFAADVRLVFSNCTLFNSPDSAIYTDGVALLAVFEDLYAALNEQLDTELTAKYQQLAILFKVYDEMYLQFNQLEGAGSDALASRPNSAGSVSSSGSTSKAFPMVSASAPTTPSGRHSASRAHAFMPSPASASQDPTARSAGSTPLVGSDAGGARRRPPKAIEPLTFKARRRLADKLRHLTPDKLGMALGIIIELEPEFADLVAKPDASSR
ncbi:uncharacterized protein AMSG_02732 [Thecamonas trahens ATCC 50062]|uniref:Bromo domain-containing protein n=1 Tax=Thecamonas trahens ATCC 50062 TaxID=461836 RepID=A0A0L0D1P4_THETB|nr:hypothetical protein AMSG_02732 [Thecamonas trahens ATCC 50062]KNC46279.1 hypothetical protein AMSG_02732 [Thecamonas trahens ATCC 50062]|eukprot:XP_013760573.1 hypothetical protein AMSG_02732 [Thecamonas trahens ATCC 50062]